MAPTLEQQRGELPDPVPEDGRRGEQGGLALRGGLSLRARGLDPGHVDRKARALPGLAVDSERAQTDHERIAPDVVGTKGERSSYTFLASEAAFESSIFRGANALGDRIADRHQAVIDAL